MKKLSTVFSNYANKGSALKKLFLLFAATTYTIANCAGLTYSKDVPIGFSLPLADLNAGDASVCFFLNNAPSENSSNTGGWNYVITRAPLLGTAETQGTNILTVTTHGAAGDKVTVSVKVVSAGGFTLVIQLGTAVSTGVSVTADALAIATAINAGTSGFTASPALGVVTLTNPVGSGALLNVKAVTLTLSAGSVQVITNTNLGSTTPGVSAVYSEAAVVVSQTPNPVINGDFINANIVDLNTAIAAYKAYTYHAF